MASNKIKTVTNFHLITPVTLKTLNLLYKTKKLYYFMISYIINFFIDSFDSYTYSTLITNSQNTKNIVIIYILIQFLAPTIRLIGIDYREDVLKNVKILFKTESYKKYNDISFNDKNKTTIQDFDDLVDSAMYAIEDELMSKIDSIISLISTIYSCFLMFQKHNTLYMLLSLMILTIITYKFIISNQYEVKNKKNEDNHEKMEKITCIKRIFLPLFETKQISYKELIDLDIQKIDIYNKYKSFRQKINNNIKLINTFGLVILFYITYNDLSKFVLLYILYSQYSTATNVFLAI
jgi:hypothetical protein